jgi:hypothetical protein
MRAVSYVLSLAAIVVMAADVWAALRLRRSLIGGGVGQKWQFLTALIVLFFLGYVVSPLVLWLNLPIEYMGLLVFAVFLFGAVFVWVVIGIIRDVLSFLNLLKDD